METEGGAGGDLRPRHSGPSRAMAKLLSCVLGPRLYKIYRERDTDRAASSVPETPTAVPAPSSSSWVSRVPPG